MGVPSEAFMAKDGAACRIRTDDLPLTRRPITFNYQTYFHLSTVFMKQAKYGSHAISWKIL